MGIGRRVVLGQKLYHFLTAEKKLCGIKRKKAVLSGTDFTGFDRWFDSLFTAYASIWQWEIAISNSVGFTIS